MRLPSLSSIAMGFAVQGGRERGQGKKGLQAGTQPQQVMGGARETQLVIGRQLPYMSVDIAMHADAQGVPAMSHPRLGSCVGATDSRCGKQRPGHPFFSANSRSNTSMKSLWRRWVMRSLIVRTSRGTWKWWRNSIVNRLRAS